MRVGLTSTEQHIAYHEHFITADSPCPQCASIDSRAKPPAGPTEAVSEIDRLKAENASLLESLRAAQEAKREAENEMVAAESQLEWLSDAITGARPIDDFGLSFGVVLEAVDLRTRAAAAEKDADHWRAIAAKFGREADVAEQRNTELEAILVRIRADGYLAGGMKERITAALHDEERRQRGGEK